MARIFFCGDIINQFCDKQFISHSLQETVYNCDYAVGNLEGVVSDDCTPILSMKQHPSTLKSLKDAGINHLLLANNHIADYGKEALVYTYNKILEIGLSCSGADVVFARTYAPHYFEIDRVKYAIINLSEAQGGEFKTVEQGFGYAWLGASCVDSIIQETKEKVDRLFVCVHAGLEHYQLPLEQYRHLYRHYCDLGADCVIASHPHIVQGMEEYNRSLIFYSLGNFYFPRTPNADFKTDLENSAFSVIISADKTNLEYEVLYHHIEEQEVVISDKNDSTDIERLSESLFSDYESNLDKQNRVAFNELLYNLLRISLNGVVYEDKLINKIKTTLMLLLKNKEDVAEKEKRMNLLHHIVNNETYRYLLSSAIEKKLYQ